MLYHKELEEFVDFVDWTENDPCIWIVSPPGCCGDLISSIINFHYKKTGAVYLGIAETGQVIFRDSNNKMFNLQGNKIDRTLVEYVRDTLSSKHTNYSQIDQIIFTNHAYKDTQINSILKFTPNAKVIRILPKTLQEQNIIQWLANFKNQGIEESFANAPDNLLAASALQHEQLLDFYFSDIFNENTFNTIYDKITNHLGLEYKLIRYDFVKYYLSRQHKTILPALLNLK